MQIGAAQMIAVRRTMKMVAAWKVTTVRRTMKMVEV